jgi:ArsR family transcriptional regulator
MFSRNRVCVKTKIRKNANYEIRIRTSSLCRVLRREEKVGKIVLAGKLFLTACRDYRVPALVREQTMKQQIFTLHADLCGTMASPKRLAILESLHAGERSVSSIAEEVGAPVSTVSQHLRLLRDKHVVLSRKDAQTVYYRIRDPRMIQACDIIRTILLDGIKAQSLVNAEPADGD